MVNGGIIVQFLLPLEANTAVGASHANNKKQKKKNRFEFNINSPAASIYTRVQIVNVPVVANSN